jgi:uncharacterized protein
MQSECRSTHIAVFCRPLISGQVKTRLIPAFGADGATAIYAQLVARTLQTVAAALDAFDATASLWVAGDVAHASVRDWATRYTLPVNSQGEGDLGARMLHCLTTLITEHESVLLIGTDCPALTVSDLHAASLALTSECPWVFTPAEDGGYVLVGSNAPRAEPFADITWSTPEVMAQTQRALQRGGLRWAEMPTRWDVDDARDVERAVAAGVIRADSLEIFDADLHRLERRFPQI